MISNTLQGGLEKQSRFVSYKRATSEVQFVKDNHIKHTDWST